jgi:hypothetical protein
MFFLFLMPHSGLLVLDASHSGLLVLDASQGEHHPQLEPVLVFKFTVLKFGLLVMTGTLLEKGNSCSAIIKHHIISRILRQIRFRAISRLLMFLMAIFVPMD